MNVLLIGTTGNYPLEISASNSKNELISKGLIASNCNVTIVNSPLGTNAVNCITYNKSVEGIPYVLFPNRNFIRNLIYLRKLLKTNFSPNQPNVSIISLSYGRFPLLLIYILFSRLTGYKLALIINEWRIPVPLKNISFFSLIRDINELFKINLIPLLCDSFLPISEFISNKLSKYKKKTFIVPALSDADAISVYQKNKIEKHFLYCGIGYFDAAIMVLKAFVKMSDKNDSELILVLNFKRDKGNIYHNEIIKIIAESNLQERVKIFSDIKYSELINLYCNSFALLIPLDENNLQDVSRFPNKVGEYAASGRPIITMNVGDIGKYFENDISSFFAKDYSVAALSSKMEEVFNSKHKADEVGQNGRRIAENELNYLEFSKKIVLFFEKL
ncbi:MAG: glycosyltransferase [Bacteroidia bacterium]|nr:glycosyltransferase [Bacteroidia bacterium]